jgi:hypothetical protein
MNHSALEELNRQSWQGRLLLLLKTGIRGERMKVHTLAAPNYRIRSPTLFPHSGACSPAGAEEKEAA